MLVTSFCPCLTTYLCLFLVRFAIFDFSDRYTLGSVCSASSNFRLACAQQSTTRMLPGSLWYPWYPSACSQPLNPCRKASVCSAFLVGWYSYRTMACSAQPLVRYSHTPRGLPLPLCGNSPCIGLAGGGTPRFLQHLQGRFIGVQHRLLTKLFAQRIVDRPQPLLRSVQQPVGHGLPGQLQALALKFLL